MTIIQQHKIFVNDQKIENEEKAKFNSIDFLDINQIINDFLCVEFVVNRPPGVFG